MKLPLGKGAYRRAYGREPEVKLINRFFEENPTNLEDQVALLSRPGTTLLKTIGLGPIRRVWTQVGTQGDALFVVSGSAFFRLNTDLSLENITGTISGNGSPEIAGRSNIVFIADGTSVKYYTGPGSQAVGTLTATLNPANNETFTVGTQTYTWKTALTSASSSNEILIGGTLALSLANAAAAINGADGGGTTYGSSTTPNLDVTAASAATTLTVTAKLSGIGGNAIATTETMANASWGGATLSGAVSGYASGTLTVTVNPLNNETVTIGTRVYRFRTVLAQLDDVLIGGSATASMQNLAAAINAGAGAGTTYFTGTVVNADVTASPSGLTCVVTSRAAGTNANSIVTTETLTSGSWGAGTLTGAVSSALQILPLPAGVNVVSLGVVAGFVLLVASNSQRFYYLEPNQLVVQPLNFYTAESGPDELINTVVVGDQAWMFGEATTEVWYPDAASVDDPFSQVQQRVFQRGIFEGTAVLLDDEVMVVGDDNVVYRVGASPVRVSDHGMEERIRLAAVAQRNNP